MKGDFHVRFRGKVEVKFLCLTRLAEILNRHSFENFQNKFPNLGIILYLCIKVKS
jgi:hypothetical protein